VDTEYNIQLNLDKFGHLL